MEKIPVKIDNFSLHSISQVKSICQPFLDKFEIVFFDFTRVYKNGTETILTSYPELIQSLYGLGLYILPANVGFLGKTKNVLLLSSAIDNGINFELLNHVRESFAVDHILNIVEKKSDYLDCYSFGAHSKDDKMVNFYLNNMDILEKFILYFKSVASPLIKKADHSRMTLPTLLKPFYKEVLTYSDINATDTLNFISNMVSHVKLELCIDKKIVKLSRRETECIIYLTSGLSIKEVARKLLLSPRTVETYIGNVKNKLKCDKINQIFDVLFDQTKLLI